jgi:hypothetical protein
VKFFQRQKRSRGSLAVSIGLHFFLISALFSIVFSYPLGQLMGIREPDVSHERLHFVALDRPTTENSGSKSTAPVKGASPARLIAPPVTPMQLPMPPAGVPVDAPARAAGGEGDGFGVTGSGLATGLVPRLPDSRIRLAAPDAAYRTPRGVSEDVDSLIDIAVGIAIDSLEIYKRQGKLPEWIKKTKDGGEWGLTPTYIALGKVKIPTALLALLPLNIGPSRSPIDVRRDAYIRQDVLENAQRSISEDDFKAAVKRIRERKERERKDKESSPSKTDVKVADPKPIPANPNP